MLISKGGPVNAFASDNTFIAPGSAIGVALDTVQTVKRIQPICPVPGNDATSLAIPGGWSFDASTLRWLQRATGSDLLIPISNLVDRANLTKVRILIAGGSYSALPSVKPTLRVMYLDTGGSVASPTPVVTDSSGTQAAFNTLHEVLVTLDTPIAIDETSAGIPLYCKLTGVGTGFEADKLGVIRLEAYFDYDRITPGG